MVLEEVVEARAQQQQERLDSQLESPTRTLLAETATEAADHRDRLEELVDKLDTDPVGYKEIEQLVAARYEPDTNTDGVLYDQLASEETAYKFYDDLLNAIESSEIGFGVNRDQLIAVLREIRAEEEAGVERVMKLMEARQ
jgi:rubrerythrin